MSTAAERVYAYLQTRGSTTDIDSVPNQTVDDSGPEPVTTIHGMLYLTMSDLTELIAKAEIADKLQRNIDGELARAFNQLRAMQVHTTEQVAALPPGSVVSSAKGFVYHKMFTVAGSTPRWGSDNWQMAGSEIGFSDKDIELPAKVLR